MLVKSNCRWESGMCDLINGDLKINITSDTQTYGLNRLFINASNGLKGIKFAVVEKKNKTSEPHSMMVLDALYTHTTFPTTIILDQHFICLPLFGFMWHFGNIIIYSEITNKRQNWCNNQ
jgi:hypothetical protein